MKPFKPNPSGDSPLIQIPDFEIRVDEDSKSYQGFVERLETDLAAMVDRWLPFSAPCAARGGLGGRGSRS